MAKTRYINKRMVVVINKMCVELSGGMSVTGTGIRDGASLGFVERIFHNEVFGTVIYPDVFHQAGAYLFYILKNHIFMDGNKRTGLACALTFLQLNSIAIAPLDEDAVFDFVISVAAGKNDPEEAVPLIAAWLADMALQ
ncbi:MAG: death-on-curing protein [Myxococcota bacterium]|jgi:death-on-curing protein